METEQTERSASCRYHPSRRACTRAPGPSLCEACAKELEAAERRLASGIFPRACFLKRYGDGFGPIAGSAAAHWVAHTKGVRSRRGPDARCLVGFAVSLDEILSGRTEVSGRIPLRVGDVFVGGPRAEASPDFGVVVDIRRSGERVEAITIEYLPPTARRPVRGDFHATFAATGSFFR